MWPTVAEIAVVGGLGCGGFLLGLLLEELEQKEQYKYVVLQVRGLRRLRLFAAPELFFPSARAVGGFPEPSAARLAAVPTQQQRAGAPGGPVPRGASVPRRRGVWWPDPPALAPTPAPPPPQATNNSIPFYERFGFVRVGAVARYSKRKTGLGGGEIVGYRHWLATDEELHPSDKPSYMMARRLKRHPTTRSGARNDPTASFLRAPLTTLLPQYLCKRVPVVQHTKARGPARRLHRFCRRPRGRRALARRRMGTHDALLGARRCPRTCSPCPRPSTRSPAETRTRLSASWCGLSRDRGIPSVSSICFYGHVPGP